MSIELTGTEDFSSRILIPQALRPTIINGTSWYYGKRLNHWGQSGRLQNEKIILPTTKPIEE